MAPYLPVALRLFLGLTTIGIYVAMWFMAIAHGWFASIMPKTKTNRLFYLLTMVVLGTILFSDLSSGRFPAMTLMLILGGGGLAVYVLYLIRKENKNKDGS